MMVHGEDETTSKRASGGCHEGLVPGPARPLRRPSNTKADAPKIRKPMRITGFMLVIR